jgi:hypothetical protein
VVPCTGAQHGSRRRLLLSQRGGALLQLKNSGSGGAVECGSEAAKWRRRRPLGGSGGV